MLTNHIKAVTLAALLLGIGAEILFAQAHDTTDTYDKNKARLRERVVKLYQQRIGEYSWYYRLVFAAAHDAIVARVIHECAPQVERETSNKSPIDQEGVQGQSSSLRQTSHYATAGCIDDDEINQAIQQNVFHIGKHAAATATYGVVFAGIMLSAYGGAKFSHFLSKRNISESTKNFINVFVPIITGMGVFSIGAPLWDPARSFIRRWAFANNQFSNKSDNSKYPSRPELEEHWLEMQRYFSVNAQISRNTLSAFLVLISPSLHDARHAYDAGRYEYAAAQLAKCLVQLRYIYSELSAEQPILIASVHSYFRNLKVSSQFKKQVVEIALILDPLSPPDSDYYERAVRSWLSLEH